MFLNNKRAMGKGVYEKRILANIDNPNLISDFKSVLDNMIIPVKINKIIVEKKPQRMCDIAVKHQNFIANGLLVHNSQQRYERVRNGLINDFYKTIGETAKAVFSEDIKGIILGGPGPSKNDFFDGVQCSLFKKLRKKLL